MEDISNKTNDELIKEIDIMSKNFEQIKLEIKALCDIADNLELSHSLYLAELNKRV